MDQQETIKCNGCKKKFYSYGFGVNRLGVRYKTCLECARRRKISYEKQKRDGPTYYIKGKPVSKQEHDKHMDEYGDMEFFNYCSLMSSQMEAEEENKPYSGDLTLQEFLTIRKNHNGRITKGEISALRNS